MDTDARVRARLMALIASSGDTQRGIAQKAFISVTTFHRYLDGGDIRLSQFHAICTALGTTPDAVWRDASDGSRNAA